MGDGPTVADLAGLTARTTRARVDDVDGQTGIVLDDGDGEVGLSEAFGQPAAIARAYRRIAATLLARAEMLDGEGRNRGWT